MFVLLLFEFVKLENKVDVKVGELLGGMKCCFMFVCVFVNDFDVLVFDELMMGFDLQVWYLMWEWLCLLFVCGKMILIIMYFMEEVEWLCDWLCVIEEGCKIVEGVLYVLIELEIGCDVIEIYGFDLVVLCDELLVFVKYMEISGEMLFCYVSDFELFSVCLKGCVGLCYLYWLVNLEDVFLWFMGCEMQD